MKIGTKSVLFGAHCFIIHPFFVMVAWIKLYGFPLHPAIWLSFFFHDLGYWGKSNMDGDEGEKHVELGANILHKLFDWEKEYYTVFAPSEEEHKELLKNRWKCIRFSNGWFPCKYMRYKRNWYNFSIYHSRFYAKKDGVNYSKLCVADKLAITLEPYWLYLPRVNWTGEIKEYMAQSKNNDGKYKTMKLTTKSQKKWFTDVCDYLRKWVNEHKEIKEDTWTPNVKKSITESGVWK
jgi:hypothetical protein